MWRAALTAGCPASASGGPLQALSHHKRGLRERVQQHEVRLQVMFEAQRTQQASGACRASPHQLPAHAWSLELPEMQW